MQPRRYQLTKSAIAVVERAHPWIFRDQLSSAASVFSDGDLLRLVDGANRVVGYGLYEADGAIAIRIVRRGPDRPDAAWLRATLTASISRRAALVDRTDGIRLCNGESDGIAAIVVDRFGDHLVIASYAQGADAIARYAGRVLAAEADRGSPEVGPAHSITLRPARRRRGPHQPARSSRGTAPDIAHFVENNIPYAVDLAEGQKTGAYLDLRGLRTDLSAAPEDGGVARGARVLNLFSYTGMLARAAEAGGADAITSVDASARALAFAAEYHVVDRERHHFIEADVFEWLPALVDEPFDIVIVDPPAMTSTKAKVPAALAAYRRLYRAVAPHIRVGGSIVAACCTSRIERAAFHHVVSEALGHRFKKTRELAPEIDHPVGFREADYLKIAWWRRTA